jgi:hypothetical protein
VTGGAVAALIELGPEGAFQQLDGEASSAVDGNDRFTLDGCFDADTIIAFDTGAVSP